jgi:hypothetical protein
LSSLFDFIFFFFPPKLEFELTPDFKIGHIVLLGQGPISYTKLITAKECTFIVILMFLLSTQLIN